ncbi:MAG: SGNH/GDSL hydrolase family protein [Bacteroidetes bacterium]|nr:SGNH/GDSL hydrolase family protein [Bacteroidota bacterium]
MKRVYNFIIIFIVTVSLFSIIIELAYRYQWMDFYRPEINGLNTKEILNSGKRKILVCGDSFAADPYSFVKSLRDSLEDYSVINGAVPGTGILQHHIFIGDRIQQYSPDIFIYQFYIGNDLFDITHPAKSENISNMRSFYWWLSDHMLSLAFLNYRFAGIRYQFYDDGGGSYKPKEKDVFSVGNYSKREKLNYLADPNLIENTLFLKNGREKDFAIFENKFSEITSRLPKETKKYLIIIPHQSQLSEVYFNRHTQLGSLSSIPYYQYHSGTLPLYIRLREFCGLHQITIIDPLEEFKKIDPEEELYYNNDPHLKSRGQQIIGGLIEKKIRFK